jgi:lipoic acid synthetase
LGGRALSDPLRVRWLGPVRYGEAYELQRALYEHGAGQHLLLLEHSPVYTLGVRGDLGHILVPPAAVGAELVRTDRGGDVTFHGPGQLVGYPVLNRPGKHGRENGMADTVAYVRSVEQVLIDALADLGLPGAGRLSQYPGVWVDPDGAAPRKIAAIGVKLSRGRTMHGFALNVTTDLAMFGHIVPCGIADKGVTALAEEGVDVSMHAVVDAVAARAAGAWADGAEERQDVAWRHRVDDLSLFSRGEGPGAAVRLASRARAAGVSTGLAINERKPAWLRAPLHLGPDVLRLKRTMRQLDLVTVCEEAGCPNLSECWSDGTATFMVLGERCTRACGFCLVDTRHPEPPDPGEPARVAQAVAAMDLDHVVVTMVARDDLADGGAAHVAAVVAAVRDACPNCAVEVLVSDLKGDEAAIDTVIEAAPDVFNHNIETVARLQRAVRPSAGYARSLAVLARAKRAGLLVKSGMILGMGETDIEVEGALADLAAIGTDIVTLGQYLRPTTHHLPVARWVEPATFVRLAAIGESFGIGHVEASPLTRSSYHARQAADAATPVSLQVSRR